MRSTVLLPFLLCLKSPVFALSSANQLNNFAAKERKIALNGALNNIGPNGSEVPGAASGLVVASPSKSNPNYFYTWTRDSALTLKMIVDEFVFGNTKLLSYIDDYITAQAVLQTVSNPSGTLLPSGLGLGEPKYTVIGTRFNGAWGRPQRDGPALRAVALITYSKWLLQRGRTTYVKNTIWPIISNDLSYVGQYWNQTGFDLWEEVSGSSFFTIQNQHRSLLEGGALARSLGVVCTGCDQAPQVLCFLQSFWNGQYLVANINVNNGRKGIDANTMLGSISTFDINAGCDELTFQPCSSKSLASFKVFVDTYRTLYTINKGIPQNQGVALGRYPEDIYQGGSAWYLITLGAAEFLYDIVASWERQLSITVDAISLAFFEDLYPNAKPQTYHLGVEYLKILSSVATYADSFLAVAKNYAPTDGSLSEQFSRETGAPLSAVDLTWSYASFVTMAQRRSGQYPASWNAHSASKPQTCAGTSSVGVYSPATAAGAPNQTVSCTVPVLFEVNATTYYGENIYLEGNVTELGAWDFDNSQPLYPGNYSSQRPLWYSSVQLPAGVAVSYAYVRQEDCNQPNIYESGNRTVVVPACGSPGITLNDAWDGPVGTSGGC